MRIFPLYGLSKSIDEEDHFMYEGYRVTRLDLLADGPEMFLWPISGTEFDHIWNWFGKSMVPGALQLLK